MATFTIDLFTGNIYLFTGDFTAGSIEFKIDISQPYYRNTTIRIYSGMTLIDTQSYAGAISPLQFTGAYPITYSVPSGTTFTVTLQSSVGGGYTPNNTTVLDTGYLIITKTGNQATPSWGSITGDITTQTDLYNEFLAKNNTTIYTPINLYHPTTKKYVDDADNLKANLSGATFTGNINVNKFIKRSTTSSITASTTQSQGQQQLTTDINEISTVNTINDVVTLPSAEAGLEILIINNGANILQIYPAFGDNLGVGLNTSTTLIAGNIITFVAYNNTNWIIK